MTVHNGLDIIALMNGDHFHASRENDLFSINETSMRKPLIFYSPNCLHSLVLDYTLSYLYKSMRICVI